VIATGITTTVRDFVLLAFQELGIELRFEGEGVSEKGIDKKTGAVVVEVDPKFFRPAEVDLLLGDPTLAKKELNWSPKTTLAELVSMMAKADYDLAKSGRI